MTTLGCPHSDDASAGLITVGDGAPRFGARALDGRRERGDAQAVRARCVGGEAERSSRDDEHHGSKQRRQHGR